MYVFGEFACYESSLKDDIDIYIGRILDFSDVKLLNNSATYTWE